MTEYSRREFVKLLAFCLSQQALVSNSYSSVFLLPEIGNKRKIDSHEFYSLSKVITNSTYLDKSTSEKIYRLIMAEPWGPENLVNLYLRLLDLQVRYANEDKFELYPEEFTNDEQWFISHLLTTWYTGVYFHEKGNQHITLEYALMYKKLSQYRHPPTYCGGEPGYWLYPPVL